MCSILDARVAEKVMGLEIVEEDSVRAVEYPKGHRMYNSIKAIPDYSTDHNAAFELGGLTTVQKDSEGLWFAMVNSTHHARHRLASTAICLAELRAEGDGEWVDNYLKEKR